MYRAKPATDMAESGTIWRKYREMAWKNRKRGFWLGISGLVGFIAVGGGPLFSEFSDTADNMAIGDLWTQFGETFDFCQIVWFCQKV